MARMSGDEYRRHLAQQNDQYFRAQFRAQYPPAVWAQMSPVQQEQAYQESRERIRLARSRWGFWRVVGVIVVAIVVLWVVVLIL